MRKEHGSHTLKREMSVIIVTISRGQMHPYRLTHQGEHLDCKKQSPNPPPHHPSSPSPAGAFGHPQRRASLESKTRPWHTFRPISSLWRWGRCVWEGLRFRRHLSPPWAPPFSRPRLYCCPACPSRSSTLLPAP